MIDMAHVIDGLRFGDDIHVSRFYACFFYFDRKLKYRSYISCLLDGQYRCSICIFEQVKQGGCQWYLRASLHKRFLLRA